MHIKKAGNCEADSGKMDDILEYMERAELQRDSVAPARQATHISAAVAEQEATIAEPVLVRGAEDVRVLAEVLKSERPAAARVAIALALKHGKR